MSEQLALDVGPLRRPRFRRRPPRDMGLIDALLVSGKVLGDGLPMLAAFVDTPRNPGRAARDREYDRWRRVATIRTDGAWL